MLARDASGSEARDAMQAGAGHGMRCARASGVGADSDENGRKWVENPISTSIYIFLRKQDRFGNETGICGVRKRTNTVGNSTETVGCRELKLEYRTSLYSQVTITHKNSSHTTNFTLTIQK
jgi:hypothetical protein